MKFSELTKQFNVCFEYLQVQSEIKNNVTGIKKTPTFKSVLEEAKNIARIFSIYFENNFLKNEN